MEFSEARENENVFLGKYDINEEIKRLKNAQPRENLGKITSESIKNATEILQKYKLGKANLEARIIDNEEWYRLQHWKKERYEKNKSSLRSTGWLFSDIDNKHADFMDNFPECTVLPREKTDEQAAKDLTDILPVVLNRNNFKDVYSETCLYKLKNGTGIYSVLWNPSASKGLGDISVQMVDALNLFWEPGIKNIQESSNVFFVELVSHDALRAAYPDIKELKNLSAPTIDIAKYLYNDVVTTDDKASVVNWYYKVRSGHSSVLHYVRYVNDTVLYASENDPQYAERGWYDHGKYPFVFDVLNPDAGTPFGFGLIDVGRETQEDIDEMNSLIMQTTKRSARRRFFISSQAQINEKELSDFDKDYVHVQGSIDDAKIKEIPVSPLSGAELNVYQNKVQELKEITANRDVTVGQTSGSVTAASAIAALQESGNKTSRAMISKTYNAFREVCEICVELIRQFYDVQRTFRILGDRGQYEYKSFSAGMIRGVSSEEFGVTFSGKDPEFDFEVRTYKSNPYSRAAQNQDAVNFYNMGFFNPQNDTQSLAALNMLEFEGKERVIETIQKNGQTQKILTEYVPMMLQAVAMLDRVQGTNNAAMIGKAFGIEMPTAPVSGAAAPESGEGKAEIAKTDSMGQSMRGEHHTVEKAKERSVSSTAARG